MFVRVCEYLCISVDACERPWLIESVSRSIFRGLNALRSQVEAISVATQGAPRCKNMGFVGDVAKTNIEELLNNRPIPLL